MHILLYYINVLVSNVIYRLGPKFVLRMTFQNSGAQAITQVTPDITHSLLLYPNHTYCIVETGFLL